MNYITNLIDVSYYNDSLSIPLICIPVLLEEVKKEIFSSEMKIDNTKTQFFIFGNNYIENIILKELGIDNFINHTQINKFTLFYDDILYVADCSKIILPTDEFLAVNGNNGQEFFHYSNYGMNKLQSLPEVSKITIRWFKFYYQKQ